MPSGVTEKTKRRSPIKKPALRMPGESLQEEIIDVVFGKWFAYAMVLLMAWGLVLIEWVRVPFHVRVTWQLALIDTGFPVIVTIIVMFKLRGTVARVRNLRLGREGEVAVGQFLDEYARQRGYKVLHDLQGDGFNVDHVLIGPGGIFTIDTKTHSKPTMGDPVISYDGQRVLIDGQQPDRDPVAQAKAEARFVRELLEESTGRRESSIPVQAVLLYPGWNVEPNSSGREVWVLNPKAFISFLDHQDQPLSNENVCVFYSHLRRRNRGR
jgi:Nuclease-related domain